MCCSSLSFIKDGIRASTAAWRVHEGGRPVQEYPAWHLHAPSWKSPPILRGCTFYYFLNTILRAVHTRRLQHQESVNNWVGSWRHSSTHHQSSMRHVIAVLWWDRGDPTPHHQCGFSQPQDSCDLFCFGKECRNIMLFWGKSIACVCPSQDLWAAVALHFLFQEWVADVLWLGHVSV